VLLYYKNSITASQDFGRMHFSSGVNCSIDRADSQPATPRNAARAVKRRTGGPMLLTFYIIRNAKRSPRSLARKEVERR